ncbi:hypothetical protein [Ferrimicrobium sp.]|uniref:hypothetical protein n=1 Tax=Ferrimicrobium sp. TaxID=2926050 RepID=UPI002631EF90|nr:hypothetical protein [Ferrimicrobium sp.]
MTETSWLRNRAELDKPASTTVSARRGWPFSCISTEEVERCLHVTDIGDPNVAVDELLMMVLQRIVLVRSQSSPGTPSQWRDVWLRAYAGAATALDAGLVAAMDAVANASLEWQALIQYVGPERLPRAVADEFRFLILDRERCRALECHELWEEHWTRRQEATSVPNPDQNSLENSDARSQVGTSFESMAKRHAEAFERYWAAKHAWELAWDSALRTLWTEPDVRDSAYYTAARHLQEQEARASSVSGC